MKKPVFDTSLVVLVLIGINLFFVPAEKTEAYPQEGAPIQGVDNSAVYAALGDSLTACAGIVNLSNCYPYRIGTTEGWQTNDIGVNGTGANDPQQIGKIISTPWGPNSRYYTWLCCMNDMRNNLTSLQQINWSQTVEAGLWWLATTAANRISTSSPKVIYTGTWTTPTINYGALRSTSSNGATASTAVFGTDVVVMSVWQSPAVGFPSATYNITVDDTTYPTQAVSTGAYHSISLQTDFGPTFFHLSGLLEENHTVTLTCLRATPQNPCYLFAFGSSSGATVTNAPWVYAGNTVRMVNPTGYNVTTPPGCPSALCGSDIYVAEFDQNLQNVVADLSSVGLNVVYVDVNATGFYVPNSVNTQADGVHPTDIGDGLIANAFLTAMSGTGLAPVIATAVAVLANPSSVTIGQTVTITATVTDTATGHRSTIPTGGVTFTDTVGSTAVSLNSGAVVTLDGSGVATMIGITLSGVGTHTIIASYAENRSFLSSSNTATVAVTAQVTPTVTWAQPSTIMTGTSLSGLLNASATNGSASVAGTFVYTATSQGGSPAAVTNATVLAASSYVLTATFGPTDTTTYKPATATVPLTVQHIALSVPTANGSMSSVSVLPGGTATYTLMISPAGGTIFAGPITLSVSGLPTGAVAAFTPQTIAAGTGATNVTLTIQVQAAVAANHASNVLLGLVFSPALFGMMLLPFAGGPWRPAAKSGRFVCLLVLAGTTTIAGLAGCGSSAPPAINTIQPHSYVLTITATTSGMVTYTTSINLTVQ
jgi:Bacterial Ig-like domain (group 3)